jgi:uncharacterized protein YcbK (DUF882 family)
MTGPSPHLSWAELACRNAERTPYPSHWRESRAVQLAAVFEAIRAECDNQPIVVSSAYRTPVYNRSIGGARHSQHVEGRALDLKPPKGMGIAEFYRRIRALADRLDAIGGLGRYRTFVHVDTRQRQNGRLAVWSGTGVE